MHGKTVTLPDDHLFVTILLMRQSRRGFSLLELLVAAGILVMVMLLSAINLHGAHGKANARGLAGVIADQLRLARQEALANQEPVAVCFPSQRGTRPHSQGFYVMHGNEIPRMSRVVNFRDEFPRAVAVVGTWAESSGTLTIQPNLPGSKSSRIDLDNWLTASMKDDYCFVFTPEGGVITNGLPYFNGSYHVLASSGAEFSAAAPPPGATSVIPSAPCFSPTRLGETYTVAVSSSGAIRVESGVTGATANLVIGPTLTSSVTPAPAPPFQPDSPGQPVIAGLEVFPKAEPSVPLPPGVDVLVPVDGHVTMQVTANDPSGQQLYLTWTSSEGTFSHPGEEKMQWDPQRRVWVSSWQWRPPDNAPPNQQYLLLCSVRNMSGQVAVPAVPASFNISIAPPGQICFQRKATDTVTNGYDGGHDILVMDPDGGQVRAVIQRNSFVPAPCISRDGNKIAWCEVGANGYPSGLYVANVDGSDPRLVYGDFAIVPSFSPLGDKLAFVGLLGNSDFTVSVVDLDGTNRVDVDVVANGGYGWDKLSWSPDGQKLVYQSQVAGRNGIWQAPIDSTHGAPELILAGRNVSQPSWSPDPASNSILYSRGGTLQRMDSAGTPVPFPATIIGQDASYSPDGSEILFSRGNIFRVDAQGTGGLKQLTGSGSQYPSWGP